MKSQFSRVRFSDEALTQNLTRNTATSNLATAHQIADIAEFDRRKLFRPAGYPCMRVYCVEELGISEDAASRRIHAARAALRYPELFDALADGRLHLTGINLLAAHLTQENVGALIAAAARKSKAAIERLLAERFRKSEMLALVDVIPTSGGEQSHAPAHVIAHGPVGSHALAHVNAHVARVHPRW